MASIRPLAFQPDFHSCRYCVGERGQIAPSGRKRRTIWVQHGPSLYARFIIALGLWATKASFGRQWHPAHIILRMYWM